MLRFSEHSGPRAAHRLPSGPAQQVHHPICRDPRALSPAARHSDGNDPDRYPAGPVIRLAPCDRLGLEADNRKRRKRPMSDTDTIFADRMLSLGLARVSEQAAIAAAKLIGSGDEKAADQAAVDAMRTELNNLPIDGAW
jgi:hypothetical protein